MPSARQPEAIYKVFGRKLREFRIKAGKQQEELATLSGLTRSSIANIENGKQRIMLHQLFQFAEALHVDVSVLVSSVKTGEADVAEKKSDYLEQLRQIAASPSRLEKSHAKKKNR